MLSKVLQTDVLMNQEVGARRKKGALVKKRRCLFCGDGGHSAMLRLRHPGSDLSSNSASPPGGCKGANETSPGGLP